MLGQWHLWEIKKLSAHCRCHACRPTTYMPWLMICDGFVLMQSLNLFFRQSFVSGGQMGRPRKMRWMILWMFGIMKHGLFLSSLLFPCLSFLHSSYQATKASFSIEKHLTAGTCMTVVRPQYGLTFVHPTGSRNYRMTESLIGWPLVSNAVNGANDEAQSGQRWSKWSIRKRMPTWQLVASGNPLFCYWKQQMECKWHDRWCCMWLFG